MSGEELVARAEAAAAHAYAPYSNYNVGATKPKPDLVYSALQKVGASIGTMIGDSVYDCAAAGRAGLPSIALLTGGFSREELKEAGASDVFETLAELRRKLLP